MAQRSLPGHSSDPKRPAPAQRAVDAGRVVTFGCRGIDVPDVAGSTATRYDLDVNVEDATSEFACGDADEP